MIRFAILDDFSDSARAVAPWRRLEGKARVDFFTDHVRGEALVERLQPHEAVMMIRERTPMPRALIERLPKLKLIITAGVRNRAIDHAACRERGIVVCGTGTGQDPTVELAWGLILSLARGIPAEDRALRAGRWQDGLGFGIRGKTLGILGLGKLGAGVAKVGQAFGMNVIAWSQNLKAEHAASLGARRVEKDELFAASDVLSIHVILSERTRGLVGARELSLMKPRAILANTSRAAIVDTAALVAALQAGRLAGAGLDVFDEEPLPPDAAILKAPNTVLTPHLGYVTRESYQVYFNDALEDLEAWLAGAPIRLVEG